MKTFMHRSNLILPLICILAVSFLVARAQRAQSDQAPEGSSKPASSKPAAKEAAQPDADAPPGDPANGAQLFRSIGCSDCHGDDADGAIGPPLIKIQLTFQQFMSQVRKPVGAMPNEFPPELVSDDKLIDIYAFIEHPPGSADDEKKQAPAHNPTPKGDAENGKAFFTSHGCDSCHASIWQGSASGDRINALPDSSQGLIDYVRHPKGQMPAFTETSISDKDLTDVYAYLKSRAKP